MGGGKEKEISTVYTYYQALVTLASKSYTGLPFAGNQLQRFASFSSFLCACLSSFGLVTHRLYAASFSQYPTSTSHIAWFSLAGMRLT